jgi:8-oxo-dGTP diphosphatase
MPGQQQKQPEVLPGIAVLIRDGDRVLLNKRAHVHGSGTWAPIGGHLNYGESFEHCAIRETREEFGVELADVRYLGLVTNDVFEADHKHYITLWMEARYVSGEPRVKAPDEESDVRWFSWDALPQPLFLPLQHLLEGETYPPLPAKSGTGRE